MRLKVLALSAILACAACRAGQAFAGDNVSVSLEAMDGKAYMVRGAFSVEASSAAAWDVLTDYERIPRFVSSMRSSKVKERSAGRVLVEQEAVGRAFLVSRRMKVLLDVREDPVGRIRFEDTAHGDFEFYRGSWTILEHGPVVRVVYSLEAKRKFSAPEFVAKGAFKKNARSLLQEVREEIVRRSKAGTKPG